MLIGARVVQLWLPPTTMVSNSSIPCAGSAIRACSQKRAPGATRQRRSNQTVWAFMNSCTPKWLSSRP